MREYLFRGKRIDNGEWVEGCLYITHYGTREIGCYNSELNIARWTSLVDPATVGQYIGLKDKNGKRIFEGDVVHGPNCYKEIVVFEIGGFFPFSIAGWECEPDSDSVRVIGNIHDNPELLGGKAK